MVERQASKMAKRIKSAEESEGRNECKRQRMNDKPSFLLCLLNLNLKDSSFLNRMLYFENQKHVKADGEASPGSRIAQKILTTNSNGKKEVVGYCNGLVCLSKMIKRPTTYDIYSLSTPEVFSIFTPSVADGYVKFHGFGFDFITKEYKLVIVFNSTASNDQFKCIMVFTLGTSSWREIEIPSPPLKLCGDDVYRAAISCSGVFYWGTTAGSRDMISFDLHDEKFQVFQIPHECIVFSAEEQQQADIVQHLEFNGALCVARLEKTCQNNIRKVHLYALNDGSKSICTKQSFHVSVCPPPCSDDDVRVMGSNGKVILYWFDGEHFHFYDLHKEKDYKLPISVCDTKKKNCSGGIFDYQLCAHVQNYISMKTFVPEHAREFPADALKAVIEERPRRPGGILRVSAPNQKPVAFCYLFE